MAYIMALAIVPTMAMAVAIMEPAFMAAKHLESIVGGTAASTGEFPYIVSLQYIRGNSHTCGGVMVNAHTIVTAAHCSVDQTPSTLQARAGSLVGFIHPSPCSCL